MYLWNERVTGLSCLRCQTKYTGTEEYYTGCPTCKEAGYPVSVQVDYAPDSWTIDERAEGMKRYTARLPYLTFPTLGEGGTALFDLPDLAERLGVNSVWIKNEGLNPTGSHKDRMSPFIVARAISKGIPTVVIASSGNAGASLAAYSAAAGIRCVVVTTANMNPVWERAIRSTGADLVFTKTAEGRWEYVKEMVGKHGWYPATNYIDPPVGSNYFGIQGYKTIAFEIVEKLGENLPEFVLIPCARGDVLWGIWMGFVEAKQMGWIKSVPKLIAVEPFPRLSRVLQGEDYRSHFTGDASRMPSIGGDSVSYQMLQAVQHTGGSAIHVTNQEAAQARKELARRGIYLETSSATVLTAARKCIHTGIISASDSLLMIGTSNGYKDQF